MHTASHNIITFFKIQKITMLESIGYITELTVWHCKEGHATLCLNEVNLCLFDSRLSVPAASSINCLCLWHCQSACTGVQFVEH